MATVIGLPDDIKYDFASWNPMTHGSVTFVIVLLSVRYVPSWVMPAITMKSDYVAQTCLVRGHWPHKILLRTKSDRQNVEILIDSKL